MCVYDSMHSSLFEKKYTSKTLFYSTNKQLYKHKTYNVAFILHLYPCTGNNFIFVFNYGHTVKIQNYVYSVMH